MAANQQTPRLQFILPGGRFITGDHTKKQTTDFEGRPVPPEKQRFNVGIAVRKDAPGLLQPNGAEPALIPAIWNFTAQCYAANQIVMQRMQRGFGVGTKQGGISWKIKDGDLPDENGKKIEHAEGCYVFFFGTTLPIKCCDNQNREIDPAMIKRGFYVDAAASISPNMEQGDRAGIYLNLSILRLLGHGAEIFGGLSPQQAFGAVPAYLPHGASATPVAPSGGIPGLPGMPAMSGGAAPGMPGFTQQAMPGATMPGGAGIAPMPGQGGFVPQQPAPAMGYPSSAAPVMPGVAPVPGMPQGFPTQQPPAGNGYAATGYPIDPATGMPVQPHPGFLQPQR